MFGPYWKRFTRKPTPALAFVMIALGALNYAGAAVAPVGSSQKSLVITLTPIERENSGATGIGVAYDLMGLSNAPVSLAFDSLEPMLRRTTDEVKALRAEDAEGALILSGPTVVQNGTSSDQVWRSSRAVNGPLHIFYVVPAAAPLTKFRGPHIDLQAAGGGISGAFVSFLLLPKWEGKMHVQVKWHLPEQQTVISSYGVGDTAQDTDRSSLLNTLFLAGPVQNRSHGQSKSGLSVSSLGVQPSVLDEVGEIASNLYTVEHNAFRGSGEAPFHILIRSYDGGPIMSRRADAGTFLLYLPPATFPDRLAIRSLIGHEIVHSLIRDLDDEPGEDGDWYTEGTADYFSIVLPWQAHINGVCDYTTLINDEAAMYYTNARRGLPNETLARVMWTGRDAWTIPYARGASYFADLDQKLVEHGAGINVVDLVNEMTRRISSGTAATNRTWRDLLENRVGAWAQGDWDRMMKGNVMFPTGAFGSAIVGKHLKAGFFSLGFEEPKRLDE